MEPAKKTADSFGTFLERLQGASPKTGDPGLRLLTVLDETGPTTRAALFARSELDTAAFASALHAVHASGFVTTEGEPGDETLELTDSGREVVATSF